MNFLCVESDSGIGLFGLFFTVVGGKTGNGDTVHILIEVFEVVHENRRESRMAGLADVQTPALVPRIMHIGEVAYSLIPAHRAADAVKGPVRAARAAEKLLHITVVGGARHTRNRRKSAAHRALSVSYTHLTLPTKLEV